MFDFDLAGEDEVEVDDDEEPAFVADLGGFLLEEEDIRRLMETSQEEMNTQGPNKLDLFFNFEFIYLKIPIFLNFEHK